LSSIWNLLIINFVEVFSENTIPNIPEDFTKPLLCIIMGKIRQLL